MARAVFRAGSPRAPGLAVSALIAVVLAAGRGERFGGPKVLVPWGEAEDVVPLGFAHLRARAVDCSRAVRVTREAYLPGLAAYALPPRGELIVSTQPDEDGPAGSILAALAALAPAPEAWLLVTPVDVPPATCDVVVNLVHALKDDLFALAARPTYGGRGGHPVLVRASLLLGAYGPLCPSLRDVLRSAGRAVLDVPVAEPEVTVDFDSPQELAAYLARARELPRT